MLFWVLGCEALSRDKIITKNTNEEDKAGEQRANRKVYFPSLPSFWFGK